MGLLNLFMNIIDPLGIIRKHLICPILNIFNSMFNHYRNKANEGVSSVRDVILRFGIISFAVAIIIWSAVFMYVAFYYAYMPAIAHVRPVYMQFQSCPEKKGPCSFPYSHVSLSKKQQLLMVGQSYKVVVNIEMPESPQNQELGMFMVCADMRDHSTLLRGHSCRSAILKYRSPLVQMLITWILSPFFIFGLKEEKQIIPIELFSNYEEEQLHPITDVYVEIQSQQIQFYSVQLHITADFTGLRYIMFNWPILSSAIGISTNLFFILIIFTLSWYHWSDTTWIKEAHEKYRNFRIGRRNNNSNNRITSTSTIKTDISTTPTIDDSNNLLDDDDLSILEEKSSNKSDDIEEISGASGIENEDIGSGSHSSIISAGKSDDGNNEKQKYKKSIQTDYEY